MTISQVDSPFFISEAEALVLIDANIDDIKGKIDASSAQNSNQSAANATNFDGGNDPCNGSADYGQNESCNCCVC